MNRSIRLIPLLLAFVASLASLTTSARAQTADSVELIQQPGGAPYRCCYTFVVYNRQSGSNISEYTLRIISDRATFTTGTASSPADWTVFVGPEQRSVSWFATSTASEIAPGTSKSGFVICANDTGIIRMVWETKNLDTVFTSDTLVAACRGVDCDEAFFRRVPSNDVCLYDVDVVNGNRQSILINDIRLKSITPGVTFASTTFRLPSGWLRTRIASDSMQFFTTSAGIEFGEFVEGFRFEVRNVTDSFRIIYRTLNNGDVVCFDTVTLSCAPLDAVDSLLVRPGADCCNDLRLSNTHSPSSLLDRFTVRVMTPDVFISSAPNAPPGWTRGATTDDSVFYTRTSGLAPGDTSLFAGLCFDNADASSDTVRYRWQTYSEGIPITSGTITRICLRPLTRCDSARARVDSTEGVSQRCITLTIGNRNSRLETISQVTVRIANPGTPRRILTATAPPGWQVMSLGLDSVVFGGGDLRAGEDQAFDVCVSTGDTTMRDPLTLTWRTTSETMDLCEGTLRVNANIVRTFDSALVEETVSETPVYCCYTISFRNRNDALRSLTGFQLEVVNSNVLFAEATGAGNWTVTTSGFPAPLFGYDGDTVVAGDSTPRLSFCIDARNISARPTTIPIIFRTYSGATIVTTGRLDLVCAGSGTQLCDTAIVLTSEEGDASCSYGFAIANVHTPAGPIDRVRFRIVEGDGQFAAASSSGDATAFQATTIVADTVEFSGSTIAAGDTVETFHITVGNTNDDTRTFEICSFNGQVLGCCDVVRVECGTSGLTVPMEPTGFRLGDAVPNPFSSRTTIGYELRRPASVVLVLRDDQGRVLQRLDEGARGIGHHALVVDASALPSGVYYYTLEAGGERWTRRMTVVR